MSNGNGAVALTLGAGGGFLLWYLLHDRKHDPEATTPGRPAASPAPPAATAPSAPAATTPTSASASAPTGCAVRLDPSGLTVDGTRMNVADAVTRCQAAGRADVTIIKDAPASTYAELMVALGRAGVPSYAHRNARGRRRRKQPRTVDDVDLEEFSDTVQRMADQVERDPTPDGLARGRVGERKVFIAAVRRKLRDTEYASLPRHAVDELLLQAHRAAFLELARADLVSIMDPDEVRDSEIVHPKIGSRFHFVVSERERNGSLGQFTLVVYPRGDKGPKRVRWYDAPASVTWEEARDRLVAARLIDGSLFRRTCEPGGWIMTDDPWVFDAEMAEPLPGGDGGK